MPLPSTLARPLQAHVDLATFLAALVVPLFDASRLCRLKASMLRSKDHRW